MSSDIEFDTIFDSLPDDPFEESPYPARSITTPSHDSRSLASNTPSHSLLRNRNKNNTTTSSTNVGSSSNAGSNPYISSRTSRRNYALNATSSSLYSNSSSNTNSAYETTPSRAPPQPRTASRPHNINARQTTFSGDFSMLVGNYPGTMASPSAPPRISHTHNNSRITSGGGGSSSRSGNTRTNKSQYVVIDNDNEDNDDDDDDIEITNNTTHGPISTTRKPGSRPAYIEELRQLEELRPNHHLLNYEALRTFVYPTNLPVRDYQLNIVQSALFENTLCALPTGLGKTFIASTIMLNFYRWTEDAKIIFMAPTRPLVSQQLHACLGITGMPQSDSSILMGNMNAPVRKIEWNSKRIFFATPQTVNNDLKSGILDAKSIVCLVIDEAHRSTGNQAYAEVVKFISRFNNSFRILALTATPSSTVEGVQEIIDNLNLSKVEIRTEESMDIKPYIHKKEVKKITVKFSDDQTELLNEFSKCVQPLLDEAFRLGVVFVREAQSLSLFTITASRQKYMASPASRANNMNKFRVLGLLKVLTPLAYAIQKLKLQGILSFRAHLLHIEEDSHGSKSKYIPRTVGSEAFQNTLKICDAMIKRASNPVNPFISHPKMEHLVSILKGYFASTEQDKSSRVIIFAMYRDTTAEIIDAISANVPDCRPHVFVGQASKAGAEAGSGSSTTGSLNGKKNSDGDKSSAGMNQKEQQRVIGEFRSGKYNTLIATCIGEEGLDIGEVDVIICYDSTASPIRAVSINSDYY